MVLVDTTDICVSEMYFTPLNFPSIKGTSNSIPFLNNAAGTKIDPLERLLLVSLPDTYIYLKSEILQSGSRLVVVQFSVPITAFKLPVEPIFALFSVKLTISPYY